MDTQIVGAVVDLDTVTLWLEAVAGMLATGATSMELQAYLYGKIVLLGELREAHEEGRA